MQIKERMNLAASSSVTLRMWAKPRLRLFRCKPFPHSRSTAMSRSPLPNMPSPRCSKLPLSPAKNRIVVSRLFSWLRLPKANCNSSAFTTRSLVICRHGQEAVEVLSRPLLRPRFSADRQPLASDVQKRTADHSARYERWKPQRPTSAAVGIFVGRLTLNRPAAHMTTLILLGLHARSEQAADVKGDFHHNQFDGKHCENCSNFKQLQKAMKLYPTLKTMAMALNHPVCGGICGGERGALWPA